MMGATRFLHNQQDRLCFEKKTFDSQTRPASIYVGCVFFALFAPSAWRLSSFRHILSQGWGCLLQAFFQGLRMEEEEEEERGCVRVRLVSGWRGALGTGGEEHRLHTAGRRGGGDPAASGGGAVAAVAS